MGEAAVVGPLQGARPLINMAKQSKHIVGTRNFIAGRSILTGDVNELAMQAGRGASVNGIDVGLAGSKEVVNFGKTIGYYVNPEKGFLSPGVPTTRGIIIYSKTGIHIVPAAP